MKTQEVENMNHNPQTHNLTPADMAETMFIIGRDAAERSNLRTIAELIAGEDW